MRSGNLTLDRPRRVISAAGKRMRLTPKEYQLLEYFILHSGEVVTRTDLLEKVWEIQFDPSSNVVDVHVARLRAKLRRIDGAPRLLTVRGSASSSPPTRTRRSTSPTCSGG